jgi:hypothetical protein
MKVTHTSTRRADYGKLLTFKVNATNDKIVSFMIEATQLIQQVAGIPLPSIISETLINYLRKTVVGGKLLDAAARAWVAAKGVEVADLSNVNAVATQYVVDEVLTGRNDQATQRPKPSVPATPSNPSVVTTTPPREETPPESQGKAKGSAKKKK